METVKLNSSAANYVSETIQGAGSTASKEANKHVAKDSDAKVTTRAQAAVDAVGDKADEKSTTSRLMSTRAAQH
ncbi:glucose-repressible protein [Penicillium verhagenii]|uniref:glucose-repressible protein n=1 Tax=Penicillium verhagenii TaxID=1562060 RepID=UPI0025456042|nr:glucose-repressible protein [Penicillium verhagenii]KAJ5915751.1 glucose-repressible protein [Penicillium verhagenii]